MYVCMYVCMYACVCVCVCVVNLLCIIYVDFLKLVLVFLLSCTTQSGGEENILCQPNDRWKREGIFLHEFVHGLHNVGVTSVIRDFDSRLSARYNYLRRTGYRWRNTYAMSTDREYLAEGAQSFFEDNDEQIPTNGIHNYVDTRAELLEYDSQLYDFAKEIFPCKNKFLLRCDAVRGEKYVEILMDSSST